MWKPLQTKRWKCKYLNITCSFIQHYAYIQGVKKGKRYQMGSVFSNTKKFFYFYFPFTQFYKITKFFYFYFPFTQHVNLIIPAVTDCLFINLTPVGKLIYF